MCLFNKKKIIVTLPLLLSFQAFNTQADQPTVKFPPITPPDALSNEKPKLPDTQLRPPQKKPKFSLPPINTTPDKNQRLSSAFKIFVKKIQLIGNTAFTEKELQEITAHFENRTITNEELQALRHQLTRYYIDHGYINSGVTLPDQDINNGIIQLQVIEGELTHLNITGNDWLKSSYIDNRMTQSFTPPLNINNIQDRLLLLQQDPLIDHVNAELRPGLKPGESNMNLHITEAKPYQAGIVAANNISPSIGGISGNFWLTHRNLTGYGDALFFSYSVAEGLDDFSGSYSIPFTAKDTRLKLYYQNSESDVIESPIEEDVNIHSRSETYGISLSQPFFRTPEQALTLSLAFEHRRSKTFINTNPFPFAAGVPVQGEDKGESKLSVLRFSQDWLHRSQTQVIASRSTFNLGFDVLGATNNKGDTPDGQFFSWLGQFQWVRRIPLLDSQLIFRTDAQLASESLLPLEKFSVGGMHSVRGYRENQLVRDNGAVTSLEWRIPIFRLPIPGISKTINDGSLQIATFADFGWSDNQNTTDMDPEDQETLNVATPGPKTIGSWGLGLRWDPSPVIHSEFYWGVPFRSIKEGTKHDIQDYGIHFQVNIQSF
ncbi:MAG: ShlB/FhaC/HecB family hemolysin secretion/activation protein [Methylococcaceae bacterium]|nr:ShlB/FhaC/HecB family hemolysin secretion/activation protein [Methylococcaceae bacterium]